MSARMVTVGLAAVVALGLVAIGARTAFGRKALGI